MLGTLEVLTFVAYKDPPNSKNTFMLQSHGLGSSLDGPFVAERILCPTGPQQYAT